ncbi:hypothetical protein EDB87DRAFT_1578628 [Lactarius vividus]|nr:hypothetical protein EDB87DRAFT_1578628 [Lactarius vividus]
MSSSERGVKRLRTSTSRTEATSAGGDQEAQSVETCRHPIELERGHTQAGAAWVTTDQSVSELGRARRVTWTWGPAWSSRESHTKRMIWRRGVDVFSRPKNFNQRIIDTTKIGNGAEGVTMTMTWQHEREVKNEIKIKAKPQEEGKKSSRNTVTGKRLVGIAGRQRRVATARSFRGRHNLILVCVLVWATGSGRPPARHGDNVFGNSFVPMTVYLLGMTDKLLVVLDAVQAARRCRLRSQIPSPSSRPATRITQVMEARNAVITAQNNEETAVLYHELLTSDVPEGDTTNFVTVIKCLRAVRFPRRKVRMKTWLRPELELKVGYSTGDDPIKKSHSQIAHFFCFVLSKLHRMQDLGELLQHTALSETSSDTDRVPLDYVPYHVNLGQLEEAIETLESFTFAHPQLAYRFAAIDRDFEELTKSIPQSHKLSIDNGVTNDLMAVEPEVVSW